MLRNNHKIIIILLVIALLGSFSCKKNSKKQVSKNNQTQQIDSAKKQVMEQTLLIKFKNKVFGIPSPILVSKFVKQLNTPFNADLLNSTQNTSNYISSFKQAVNIGIYSADLAYLNIYEQNSMFDDYFKAIKVLSEQLDLLNAINQNTLDRIEKNTENLDSLMYLTSTLFRDIDDYLTENDQQKTGALILAGGWIETMYFLTQIYQSTPNKDLLIRIGEQKSPLNNLLNLLMPYYKQNDENLDNLYEQLFDLSQYFNKLNIEYQYDSIQVDAQNHMSVIYSQTSVNIDDLEFQKISNLINSLRNWLIQ